ncbi:MAG TPA: PQQ-dependent sugar dehydrogenase [Xanthobacteraceae bacterium]|jgi:glucose/arabinose dehydrogenase|nr:PQQ-dependent sugar dehydrogenase [Xanthobacteraceae bacterium]
MKFAQTLAVALVSLVPAASLPATAQTFRTSAGEIKVETVARGLSHPWSLAFLPDGRMLVTERPGRMRFVSRDGTLSPPFSGIPKLYVRQQAGLLDVALDRDYANNHTLYFCYIEPADGGGREAVDRARVVEGERPRLEDVQRIFQQRGPAGQGLNMGCRIAQGADGNLFVTLGDHFQYRDLAQNLDDDIGKIVRIRPDGSVPPDNPFVDRKGARPEIWTYGNRNPQGLAFDPKSGKLWEIEHGPRGGDEVNIIEPGRNYGWPVIGYGVDYSGAKIHESTHKAGMEQPLKYWVPSIAPSGLAFYEGDLFPAWRGNLFLGALAGELLVRLTVEGNKVTHEERLLHQLGERIRDVRQGPDGALWLLTDNSNGRILRLAPAR